MAAPSAATIRSCVEAALPLAERLDPESMIADLQARGLPARYSANADEIVAALVPELRSGDIVAVFSNGSFGGIHEKLLARLR
jgi:UDP-N-acetylmuramate: L-alanyl-gamma-D-glutamyl-meso-diaminopimelate ligase